MADVPCSTDDLTTQESPAESPAASPDDGAQAVATCSNECVAGAKMCAPGGGGYRTCGNYDSDPCTEWGPTVGCPSGQACSGGTCKPTSACVPMCPVGQVCQNGTCVTPCTNECPQAGLNVCEPDRPGVYRTCGNFDSDPCLEWSYYLACPTGTICQSGSCQAQ